MLQRDENGAGPEPVQLHGFVVGAELTKDVTLQEVINKLSDALNFVEGVGRIDVQYLGQVMLEEGTTPTPIWSESESLPIANTDVER